MPRISQVIKIWEGEGVSPELQGFRVLRISSVSFFPKDPKLFSAFKISCDLPRIKNDDYKFYHSFNRRRVQAKDISKSITKPILVDYTIFLI